MIQYLKNKIVVKPDIQQCKKKTAAESKKKTCKNSTAAVDWSKFDHIYCIHYLPFNDRLDKCIENLKRLGIYQLPQFSFEWTVPNKFYDVLLDINRYENIIDRKRIHAKNLNLQINRLNMFKKAWYHGFNRILVIEDDNMFYDDNSVINEYVTNIPEDYDIVNFDYWFLNKDQYKEVYADKKRYVNDYFIDISGVEKLWNMSFASMSRKGIKYLIDSQEAKLRPMDNFMAWKPDNAELAKDIKFCISKMNLSIQKLYENRQNYREASDNKYEGQYIDYKRYV